jgi:hypothetical protein
MYIKPTINKTQTNKKCYKRARERERNRKREKKEKRASARF